MHWSRPLGCQRAPVSIRNELQVQTALPGARRGVWTQAGRRGAGGVSGRRPPSVHRRPWPSLGGGRGTAEDCSEGGGQRRGGRRGFRRRVRSGERRGGEECGCGWVAERGW